MTISKKSHSRMLLRIIKLSRTALSRMTNGRMTHRNKKHLRQETVNKQLHYILLGILRSILSYKMSNNWTVRVDTHRMFYYWSPFWLLSFSRMSLSRRIDKQLHSMEQHIFMEYKNKPIGARSAKVVSSQTNFLKTKIFLKSLFTVLTFLESSKNTFLFIKTKVLVVKLTSVPL